MVVIPVLVGCLPAVVFASPPASDDPTSRAHDLHPLLAPLLAVKWAPEYRRTFNSIAHAARIEMRYREEEQFYQSRAFRWTAVPVAKWVRIPVLFLFVFWSGGSIIPLLAPDRRALRVVDIETPTAVQRFTTAQAPFPPGYFLPYRFSWVLAPESALQARADALRLQQAFPGWWDPQLDSDAGPVSWDTMLHCNASATSSPGPLGLSCPAPGAVLHQRMQLAVSPLSPEGQVCYHERPTSSTWTLTDTSTPTVDDDERFRATGVYRLGVTALVMMIVVGALTGSALLGLFSAVLIVCSLTTTASLVLSVAPVYGSTAAFHHAWPFVVGTATCREVWFGTRRDWTATTTAGRGDFSWRAQPGFWFSVRSRVSRGSPGAWAPRSSYSARSP